MRIDYRQARAEVTLREVLTLVDFVPSVRHGEQWRGRCPLHDSRSAQSRSFAAHVGKSVWHCFGCGAGGNALDLWQAWTELPFYAAVIDLYAKLGRTIPTKERTMPGS